jgi:hypothetical protein
MPRRVSANTSAAGVVREALIADRERMRERWPLPPGEPDELIEDLRAHVPVMVSAAFLEALLPGSRFGSGSDDEFFLLDERDQLSEYAG